VLGVRDDLQVHDTPWSGWLGEVGSRSNVRLLAYPDVSEAGGGGNPDWANYRAPILLALSEGKISIDDFISLLHSSGVRVH
jgi:hypothetical protein